MSGKGRLSVGQVPANAAISAGVWDRRRGCRAAESPACCRYRASARAFPDRPLQAGTARHRIWPVCRQAARPAGRSWCPPAPRCHGAASTASARNRLRTQAARFEPPASPSWEAPAHGRHRRPPSARKRKGLHISFASGATIRAHGGSAETRSFQALR